MKTFKNYQELVITHKHEIPPHSDMFRFTQIYESFGIECKIAKEPGGDYKIALADSYIPNEEWHTISENRFCGHTGFYTLIIFDKKGKFQHRGFWE